MEKIPVIQMQFALTQRVASHVPAKVAMKDLEKIAQVRKIYIKALHLFDLPLTFLFHHRY